MKIMLLDFLKVVNSAGGAERVFCNMANEFVKRGYNVYAVCCDWEQGVPFYELDERVKFINIDGSGKQTKFARHLKIEKEILRLLKKISNDNPYDNTKNKYWSTKVQNVINDIQPDIIVAYDLQSVCILKNILNVNIPVIAMFHSNANITLDLNASKKEIQALNKVDYVQVLLKSDIDTAKKYLEVPVVQIPNIVPQFKETANLKKEKSNYTIIFLGRLDKKLKRPHLLIEAFGKINKDFPNWRIDIWGGGVDKKYYNKLKKMISKYNIEKKVKLCGTTNEVNSVLINSDIFAFPSACEGFGLSLGEAMSAGLPCVGFKTCSAVNELIVDDETGILCDDGVMGFAEGLKKLMQDQEKRIILGTAAKEEMKKFAAEKIWDEWEFLINECYK